MPQLTLDNLPQDIIRRAEAQVASGRFATIEDVICAGVEALDIYEETADEWLNYLRQQFIEGEADIERGHYVTGTPAELMAEIQAEVTRLAEKQGQ